jgi:hypothetical protein
MSGGRFTSDKSSSTGSWPFVVVNQAVVELSVFCTFFSAVAGVDSRTGAGCGGYRVVDISTFSV